MLLVSCDFCLWTFCHWDRSITCARSSLEGISCQE